LFSNLLTERICEGETKDDIKEEERVGKEGEYKNRVRMTVLYPWK